MCLCGDKEKEQPKKQNLYPKVMDIDSVTRKLRKAIIGFLGAVKANVLFIFSC